MTRIVNLYLMVTGALAFLALAMPWLVILGMFMLILPGLILALAPTAFLWGLGFAIPWYALRVMLGDHLAIVPAAGIAAAFFWLVPQPSLAQSKARLAQSIRAEVMPAEPIKLSGDILLSSFATAMEKGEPNAPFDRAELERRPYVCDALCAALLATPGVTSVTVNSHGRAEDGATNLTLHARTFRLVPREDCKQPTVRPTNPDELGLSRSVSGPSRERVRQLLSRPLQAEWDVRLSTRECIIAEPPRGRYDFIISKHSYRAFADEKPRRSDWSLGPLEVQVDRLDVVDGAGRILLRKTLARTSALAAPLNIAAVGGLENFRFQWGRRSLSNGKRYESFNANQLLDDHTSLRTDVDFTLIMQASRDRLAEALADPALPASDPAFQLSEPWLNSLDGQQPSAADRGLVVKLLRDPRVTKFGGLWAAIKAMGDDAVILREPMVERIATMDLSSANPSGDVGRSLGDLPKGAFANLTAVEKAILADPARRVLAPGLISRQADRGAAAVPMLLDILEFHLRDIASEKAERMSRASNNMVPVDRVRMAFCLLGPLAASALPAIERLEAEGLVDRRFGESREWQLMLVRLGKPVGAIPKPKNLSGTEAQLHRNLQERLDRFRPDRCGPQWS